MLHPVDSVAILEHPFEGADPSGDESLWASDRRRGDGQREVYPGDVVMGPDGTLGEVVRVMADHVACRPLPEYGDDGPATIQYHRSAVVVIDQPGDVLTVAERVAFEDLEL